MAKKSPEYNGKWDWADAERFRKFKYESNRKREKKFYQTNEFKEISKEWEKRLEQSGLGDIEKDIGSFPFGERALKQNSSNAYRQMEATRRQSKEEYYQQLSSCLHDAVFDNEVDRIVMILKAEGAKITEICSALFTLGKSRYRRTVRLIIRKYEDRWGIRKWAPNQLRYRWKKRQPIP